MHSQSRQSVRQIQPYEIQSFTRTCEELAIAKTGFDFRLSIPSAVGAHGVGLNRSSACLNP